MFHELLHEILDLSGSQEPPNSDTVPNRALATSTQTTTSLLTASATTNLTLSHAAEDQEDIYWTIVS